MIKEVTFFRSNRRFLKLKGWMSIHISMFRSSVRVRKGTRKGCGHFLQSKPRLSGVWISIGCHKHVNISSS